MRIAQVAPLIESVPPSTYGGTERIVSFLTEELTNLGHDVTLFASGDSTTSARLVPCCPRALRSDPVREPLTCHLIQAEEVARMAGSFDCIHYHADYLHFPTASRMRTPHLTTLHGRLDLPELKAIYRTYPGMPVVSISNAQRKPLPEANWVATVYHGLPEGWGGVTEPGTPQLAFLGRISPEKRVDRAIEIAIRANQKLVIAAKVDRADEAYFREISPLLDHPLITFVGEVDDHAKREILMNSTALLFPIDWPEPFGLVMIEAMACGVPVIAFGCGSVPEVVEHGVTGFVVSNVSEAVLALESVWRIDRTRCRDEFLRRFSAARMAADYVAEYERLIEMYDSSRTSLSVVS